MTEKFDVTLIRMRDTDLMPANPQEDVRGRPVVDRDGEEVGDVDGLLIDEAEQKVRFLQVAAGGFLGIGEKKRLVPVDAVTAVDDAVHVDLERRSIAESAEYDPELVESSDYYQDLYAHYGYAPFWGVGYAYPPYPFR